MERMGLVSQVEAQLERMISLGQLPADGSLPSEQTLARRYDVSRATLREALLRLCARGLVVQRQGRRTRAVALDEAVTLETLGVALHGESSSHPERRRLLEGFLELKRDTVVELLAACCKRASPSDLELLKEACFALGEAARWEEGSRGWAKREFELLRLAARAADRPGHFLLIQSLERSFWGMAARVLPHLDSEAIQKWAQCAFHALGERDEQALRRELLPLLQTSDEHVLGRPAPASQADDTPESHHTEAAPRLDEGTAPQRAEAAPLLEEEPAPHHTEAKPLQAELAGCRRTEAESLQEEKATAHRTGAESLAEERTAVHGTEMEPLPEERAAMHRTEAEPLYAGRSTPEPMKRELPAPTCSTLSGCQTPFCPALPAGSPQPEAPSSGSSPSPDREAGREPTPARSWVLAVVRWWRRRNSSQLPRCSRSSDAP